MDYDVVITAAGQGTRMGLGYNKLLYKIDQEMIIQKTVQVFINDYHCKKIILVAHEKDISPLKLLFHSIERVVVVPGGETRSLSVYQGLQEVECSYVMIHDGARPNVTIDLIERIKESLNLGNVAVIPYVTPRDAIVYYETMIPREDIKMIQTPQAFETKLLKKCFQKAVELDISSYRDESSLVQKFSLLPLTYILGETFNIKITTSEDLPFIKSK